MIQDSLAKNNGREKFVCVCMMKFHQKQVKPFGNQEKENKIGYKYRLTSNPVSVTNYIKNGIIDATIKDEKVISELEQLRKRYGVIKPKMYIYYDRVSYKGIKDKSSLNH